MTTHWIIGATSGIGRAVAEQALQRGETVYASGRDTATLSALAAQFPQRAFSVPLDISNFAQVKESVANLPDNISSVQIYAGTYTPTAVAAWNWDDVTRTIDINLTGVLAVIHHILPKLRAQAAKGHGCQLAICASVAGFIGLPNGQPYSATKAALINLAESLRAEELAHARKTGAARIDVRVINPGFVRTRLTAKNSFTMPFLMEPEAAAQSIWRQLGRKNRFDIAFPLPMVVLMKTIATLPYRVYFFLTGRM